MLCPHFSEGNTASAAPGSQSVGGSVMKPHPTRRLVLSALCALSLGAAAELSVLAYDASAYVPPPLRHDPKEDNDGQPTDGYSTRPAPPMKRDSNAAAGHRNSPDSAAMRTPSVPSWTPPPSIQGRTIHFLIWIGSWTGV